MEIKHVKLLSTLKAPHNDGAFFMIHQKLCKAKMIDRNNTQKKVKDLQISPS